MRYRASGREVLDYIHDMAHNELIEVRVSTTFMSHSGSEGNFIVHTELARGNFDLGKIAVRALVFAPGAHETTAGVPHLPLDLSEVVNGACILHSSMLTEYTGRFYSASTKYVVGASKAAMDVSRRSMLPTRVSSGHIVGTSSSIIATEGTPLQGTPFHCHKALSTRHKRATFI